MTAPEEYLRCAGFYGFGAGYAAGAIPATSAPGTEWYCNRCPLAQECWDLTRERVLELFPARTLEFLQMVEEHDGDGRVAMLEWLDKHDGEPEPYTMVSFTNYTCGSYVGAGLPVPKDIPHRVTFDRAKGTYPVE